MKNSTAPDLVARTQMTVPAASTVPTSRLLDCAAIGDALIIQAGTTAHITTLGRTPSRARELQTERRCMARSTAQLATRTGAAIPCENRTGSPSLEDDTREIRVTLGRERASHRYNCCQVYKAQ